MFDIGFTELLIAFIIALVVLGPEKLPGVARTVGRWSGQARGYLRNLTAELDREAKLADLRKQLDEANKMVRSETQTLKQSVKDATAEAKPKPPAPASTQDETTQS